MAKKLKTINGIFMIPNQLVCLSNHYSDKLNNMKEFISKYYHKERDKLKILFKILHSFRNSSHINYLLDFNNTNEEWNMFIDTYDIYTYCEEYLEKYPNEDVYSIIISIPAYCNYENNSEKAIQIISSKLANYYDKCTTLRTMNLSDVSKIYCELNGKYVKSNSNTLNNMLYTQLNSTLDVGIYGFPRRIIESFYDFENYYNTCFTRFRNNNITYFDLGYAKKELSEELKEEVKQFFIEFPEGYICFR